MTEPRTDPPAFPVGQPDDDVVRLRRTRGEPSPIDLDGIEMRWAGTWSEADDGQARPWLNDIAALVDEVHRLRRVSNRYFEEMARLGDSRAATQDPAGLRDAGPTAGREPQPLHESWCDDDNHGYERACRRTTPDPAGLREALDAMAFDLPDGDRAVRLGHVFAALAASPPSAPTGADIAETFRRVSNRPEFKYVYIDWTALGAAFIDELTKKENE